MTIEDKLIDAICDNKFNKVRQIIQRQPELLTAPLNEFGWPAILFVVSEDEDGSHEPMARWLIDRGVPISRVYMKEETALGEACNNGKRELASLFLEHGADPTFTTSRVFTILMWAASSNNDVARIVLRHGGALHQVDDESFNGQTAVSMAVVQGNAGSLGALLEAGADPTKGTGRQGNGPMETAIELGRTLCMKVAGGMEAVLPPHTSRPSPPRESTLVQTIPLPITRTPPPPHRNRSHHPPQPATYCVPGGWRLARAQLCQMSRWTLMRHPRCLKAGVVAVM